MTTETLLQALKTWAARALPPILTAAVVFLVGWFVIKLAMRLLEKVLLRSKLNVTLHAFIRSLVRITLIVLLAASCATMSGLVEAASLVTALGAAGLALSLAVKDSLTNLAGGLVLLAAKPFAVGDYIEADGIGGTVAKIDLVHTQLRTPDNKEIFIPNGQMSNAKVVNYSAEPQRRLDLEFTIGYDSDLDRAKAALARLVEAHPLALSEPAPTIRLLRQDASALVLACRVWVDGPGYWDLYFDLMEQAKLAFDREGISIPYNQLDVHLSTAKGENLRES